MSPLRRVSVAVLAERAEEARARMLELFPDGFEELDTDDGVELVAYTDGSGEEQLWQAFGGARGEDVAADWAERWRTFHRPSVLGSMWIGPPWLEPPPDLLAVVIDPGRAFGTGGHMTTQLCLQLLESLDRRGSLLDVGCGSGVLSIAAAKLGFGPVVAVDCDPNAVEATHANAAANGVTLDVRRADGLVDELPITDVVIANIALEVVAAVIARVSAPVVVTSGYLASEQPDVAAYRPLKRLERGGWAADLLTRGE